MDYQQTGNGLWTSPPWTNDGVSMEMTTLMLKPKSDKVRQTDCRAEI